MKLSESVRRLEDTIESLRKDNKDLRDKLKHQEPQQKEFMITYKWQVTELPTEWNKEWDMYTISYKDRMTGKIITDKWLRYKNEWRNPNDVARMVADERDEIIDHQKRDIVKLRKEIDRCKKLNDTLINNARSDDEKYKKLEKELWARLKQVEDLQSSYKTLQEENKKLKSKLEQTVDEYDEDYKTFHRDDDKHFDENFRKIFGDFLWRDPF